LLFNFAQRSQEDNEMGAAERRTESSTQKSDQEQESPGSPRKKKKKKKDNPQASESQETNLFDGDDISIIQETPLKKKQISKMKLTSNHSQVQMLTSKRPKGAKRKQLQMYLYLLQVLNPYLNAVTRKPRKNLQ
jgi:uncharacterized Zn ribbon protein